MIISLDWLKDYVDIDVPVKELAETLTMLGFEVEEVTPLGAKFDQFFVGKVLERIKHPDADTLSVCTVTVGEAENRTIVCGAPNVDAGQFVAVAIEGAVVPSAGFTIEKRKLRGVVSQGMICSVSELELGEDHDGIWVLDGEPTIGMPLAEYLGANDVAIDLSITPNRADSLSHIGIAREVAARYGKTVKRPELKLQEDAESIDGQFTIELRDTELCPRYAGRIVKDVTIAESPDWLKRRLEAVGLRPRNNIVDITNYVLMECGHPLHAFDLDELKGNNIIVKTAAEGQKFTTLDDKERTLDAQMLMICDAERDVAIAGVMGGQNSEISDTSKNVFIESAWFKPASVRRTSKKLAIQSDASYRFERGADVNNVRYALDRAAQLMAELGGGRILAGVIDEYPQPVEAAEVSVRVKRACEIIGVDVSAQQAREYLAALGFDVITADGDSITVRVPSYRIDIEQEADLIEEIARLHGYETIQEAAVSGLPLESGRVPAQLRPNPMREEVGAWLRSLGFSEISTPNQIDKTAAALSGDSLIELANPLGEELSIMRPSVLPSVLRVVERNLRFDADAVRVYEIGKVFNRDADADEFIGGIREGRELVIALSGTAADSWSEKARDVDFFDIKGVVEALIERFAFVKLRVKAAAETAPWFGGDCVQIYQRKNVVGYAGRISSAVAGQFGIEQDVFVCVLDFSALEQLDRRDGVLEGISPFPVVKRDLAFVVDKAVAAGDILAQIERGGAPILQDAHVFDVFEGESLGEGKKSVAFALRFNAIDRTLKDADVNKRIDKIVASVQKQLGGELR